MAGTKSTPVTPTDEGCASWSTEMANSAGVIKKIKRLNNFPRQSPEPESSHHIELPQPIFREIPVHVTRTPNRCVQAIPPPSAQPQALPSRRKNERRRRQKGLGGNGDGDGSESDSGGDERRNGRHSPDGPLRKRKPPPPEVEPPSRDPRSLKGMHVAQKAIVLSPEEEERVQNLKRLHAFERTFGDRLDSRSLNRVESKRKREALLERNTIPTPSFEFSKQVEQNQAILNEYLDESLYSAIVDDRLSRETDNTEKQSVITTLIAETESKVTEIIRRILLCGCSAISDQASWPGTAVFIYTNADMVWSSHWFQFPGYIRDKVRIDRAQFDRLPDDKDPLIKTYLDLIMDGTPDGNFGGLPITEILFFSGRVSHRRNRLTPEYTESLRSRVGATTFDALVSRRTLRSVENPLEEFKRRMKAVHMDVSQEFFQFGTEVDLALFKGGRPSTIQRVLPDDLQRMGWRQDGEFGDVGQEGAARRYWRYAAFDDHPGRIFAVDMEGEILGALDQSGMPVLAVPTK